jgi:hypothetical protein
LGAIAVGDDDVVFLDERGQGLRGDLDMMLLDIDVGCLAALEKGVAAQGNDDFHD